MALQEMIQAAEKRVNESEGEAKAKAEGELSALKAAESAGYTKTQGDLNTHVGDARSEGRTQGEKAARAATLASLGIPDDENADAELARMKEERDGQKSEAERLKNERDNLSQTNKAEKKRADELEDKLRERDRRDAISSALSEAKYEGKLSHAIGAIDALKIKEEGGSFDASEAVKALKDDGFPGFPSDTPSNPEPTPQGKQSPKGKTAADRFNERLKRKGRLA